IIAAALTIDKSKSKSSHCSKQICFRCGETGHFKDSCQKPMWCNKCNLNSHATEACKKSRNLRR
ncbi:ZCHC3 protein, partial [Leiothrix lutea]|nr:ZCHC3 protein [Leiothrix lutea]